MLKRITAILQFIWKHPLASKNRGKAYRNFFSWQFAQLINRYPILYPLVEESVVLVQKGMVGATGNIYTGLLEFDDMAFVLHALKKEDLFADIGANIGIYTVLAAKNVGANVVSIEPVPSTFNHLSNNIFLNDITKQVVQLPIGVGNENTILAFTNTIDSMNHVLLNIDSDKQDAVIEIEVKKLDDVFTKDIPVIMKMDIEGYEWPALNGAKNLLASKQLQVIIIELNGCGNAYGFKDEDIHNLLLSYSFKPYAYNPFTRSISLLDYFGKYNTIYIKDLNWATKRVKSSRKYKILGQYI